MINTRNSGSDYYEALLTTLVYPPKPLLCLKSRVEAYCTMFSSSKLR